MPWLSALFLLLLTPLGGWIPVFGPLTLGFVAARAEPGIRSLLALLLALLLQSLGLLFTRSLAGTLQNAVVWGVHLEGWFWAAVSWLLSPLGTALGRPLSHLYTSSSLPVTLLIFLAPVLPGLLLGALAGPRRR
ncbi:hypothetical protein [Deinococcus sp.]|uniref:hypothetical protein n=1 Tax=Deinococcus sp. TaxID=47478 RepID=UPI003C7EBFB8